MASTSIRRTVVRAALGATLILALAAVPVAANGGGGTDLGLDGISISSTTVNARTGVASVSGSIACSRDLERVDIYVELSQPVGRFHSVSGGGNTQVACLATDGEAGFSLQVWPYGGKFAGGSAFVYASAGVFFCTEEDCFGDDVQFGPASVRPTRG